MSSQSQIIILALQLQKTERKRKKNYDVNNVNAANVRMDFFCREKQQAKCDAAFVKYFTWIEM